MEKKAQMLGQIIVFVIGLIVISAILLFGYRVIQNLNEQRCQVQGVEFSTSLSNALEKNRGWGNTNILRFETPCDTEKVCFVDRTLIDANTDDDPSNDVTIVPTDVPQNTYEIIKNSIGIRVATNVFTVQNDGSTLPVDRFSAKAAPVRADATQPQNNVKCYDAISETIELRLEGDGQLVHMSTP